MTMQISDKLIYNEEVYNLEDELLEPFLKEIGLQSSNSGSFSANWRGYIAEFEIKNFEIHLKCKENDFFKKIIQKLGTTKIHYLNKLIVLYSDIIGEHSNWSISFNEYKNYQILEFKDGNLTNFKILNNNEFKQFKRNQFLKYIKSDDYEIEKQKSIHKIDCENEVLRIKHNKEINWYKFKFNEEDFINTIEEYILSYSKKIY